MKQAPGLFHSDNRVNRTTYQRILLNLFGINLVYYLFIFQMILKQTSLYLNKICPLTANQTKFKNIWEMI